MSKDFLKAVEDRRTYYGINKDPVVADERIQEIVQHAIMHVPSAFNSQSTRVVVLLRNEHDRLWDITKEALRQVVPSEQFGETEARINSFKNGYGTVLFYEDTSIIEGLQKQFALYKDNFPIWAQQANGMHQYVIWTALEIEGYGVSLQHYSELIEEQVKKEWDIPETWKMIGQMPFGNPTAEPSEKEYKAIEDRVLVYK